MGSRDLKASIGSGNTENYCEIIQKLLVSFIFLKFLKAYQKVSHLIRNFCGSI